MLGASVRLMGSANRDLGGIPGRIVWVRVSGTATGAVLGQMLDGRVQTEAVVIVAILGVIISFIVGMFSRRRVND